MVVVEQDRELALTNRGNAVTRARESANARAGMHARLRREAFLRTFRHGKRLGQTYRSVRTQILYHWRSSVERAIYI